MIDHTSPKIFGTTSVNEKGQVVIPVDARHALSLEQGSRLMVFSVPHKNGLLLMKAEDVENMIRVANEALNNEQSETA